MSVYIVKQRYRRIKNACLFSNVSQMLTTAPVGCQSNRLCPMRAGRLSSVPPPLLAEYQRLGGEEESSPSFCFCPSVYIYLLLLLLLLLIVQVCLFLPQL